MRGNDEQYSHSCILCQERFVARFVCLLFSGKKLLCGTDQHAPQNTWKTPPRQHGQRELLRSLTIGHLSDCLPWAHLLCAVGPYDHFVTAPPPLRVTGIFFSRVTDWPLARTPSIWEGRQKTTTVPGAEFFAIFFPRLWLISSWISRVADIPHGGGS